MQKAKKRTALIGLGSNRLYIKIAEKKEANLSIIDEAEIPISLGSDAFTTGKIGYDKVEKACKTLTDFKKLAGEYNVKQPIVVATTAIREAKNSSYIVDQIAIKTGLTVKVLDDSEEKQYIYRHTLRYILTSAKYKNSTILMAYIGTGSLGLSIYKDGRINFSQNIRVGSQKLNELLGTLQKKTKKFYQIIEDYLNSFTHTLVKMIPFETLDYFISSGREIALISRLCKANKTKGKSIISRKIFDRLYDDLKEKQPLQLMELYSLKEDQAELLPTSMGIYKILMDLVNADDLIFYPSNLADAMLYEELFADESEKMEKVMEESSILSARNLGERFSYDARHARNVENNALRIFDSIKRLHGLGSKERILLQLASILHDIGKKINIKNHSNHSYNIIRSSELIGINDMEKEMIATIAKYHSGTDPTIQGSGYRKLSIENRVKVSKLVAILKISDSLDRGHQNKITSIKVELKKKGLIIAAKAIDDISLEIWAFQRKAVFFEEVFGIKPVLKKVIK